MKNIFVEYRARLVTAKAYEKAEEAVTEEEIKTVIENTLFSPELDAEARNHKIYWMPY